MKKRESSSAKSKDSLEKDDGQKAAKESTPSQNNTFLGTVSVGTIGNISHVI